MTSSFQLFGIFNRCEEKTLEEYSVNLTRDPLAFRKWFVLTSEQSPPLCDLQT